MHSRRSEPSDDGPGHTSRPPYLAFHLSNVALLMPCLRHKSPDLVLSQDRLPHLRLPSGDGSFLDEEVTADLNLVGFLTAMSICADSCVNFHKAAPSQQSESLIETDRFRHRFNHLRIPLISENIFILIMSTYFIIVRPE